MGKRSDLSVPQRRETVLALLRREEPVAKLARRYGVSEQTLHRWRDDFLSAGEAALSGGKNDNGSQRRIAELQKKIENRDQVIGELTTAQRRYRTTDVDPAQFLIEPEGAALCQPRAPTGNSGRRLQFFSLNGRCYFDASGPPQAADFGRRVRPQSKSRGLRPLCMPTMM